MFSSRLKPPALNPAAAQSLSDSRLGVGLGMMCGLQSDALKTGGWKCEFAAYTTKNTQLLFIR
jgi:hypothetical protein